MPTPSLLSWLVKVGAMQSRSGHRPWWATSCRFNPLRGILPVHPPLALHLHAPSVGGGLMWSQKKKNKDKDKDKGRLLLWKAERSSNIRVSHGRERGAESTSACRRSRSEPGCTHQQCLTPIAPRGSPRGRRAAGPASTQRLLPRRGGTARRGRRL